MVAVIRINSFKTIIFVDLQLKRHDMFIYLSQMPIIQLKTINMQIETIETLERVLKFLGMSGTVLGDLIVSSKYRKSIVAVKCFRLKCSDKEQYLFIGFSVYLSRHLVNVVNKTIQSNSNVEILIQHCYKIPGKSSVN